MDDTEPKGGPVTMRGWLQQARDRRGGRIPPGRWLLIGAAAGVVFAYLFDPERGHRRRRLARDRTTSGVRHSAGRLARRGRAAALHALGHARGAFHRLRPAAKEFDDVALAHKVESVLFRDRRVPKGQMSINAESGVVFLRGQLESAELIRSIAESARKIPDVGEVVNLLHLPGTEAPHPRAGRLLAETESPVR
jgi:hypothetical protein